MRVLILKRGQLVAEGTVAEVIRTAAAPRTGRVRVPPEMHDKAVAALSGAQGVASVAPADGHTGSLLVTLTEASPAVVENGGGMNRSMAALVSAGVPILSFELEGARLSDAFFSVTKEDPE